MYFCFSNFNYIHIKPFFSLISIFNFLRFSFCLDIKSMYTIYKNINILITLKNKRRNIFILH